MKTGFVVLSIFISIFQAIGQEASIRMESISLPTYSFSDPDPVAKPGRIFPYFRFDGYSTTSIPVSHKMVVMENPWIKLWIAPDMGGKVYGAQDKKTGHYFIYYNHVVKFRDIALRGPWTSGGIEFNFGSIGHAPTTSNPVDYHYQSNPDGSVSCFVGALELTSRTEWRVEIRLPADKAWFETNTYWHNPTAEKTSLYQWNNASANAGEGLKYYYPGTAYIGHGGDDHEWPVTREGRDISLYRNNDYGTDHSYHVLGEYTDWFAGYYQDQNVGFGHWSRYAYKPGKKIWIWSLSRQGAIWKDLLTDKDNSQYTEIQTGFLFNQESDGSTFTPFKHMYLMPGAIETATERWFPLSGIKGVSSISEQGILDLHKADKRYELRFQALCIVDDTLIVEDQNGKVLYAFDITLGPQEIFSGEIESPDTITVRLKNGDLSYSLDGTGESLLERPFEMPGNFNWESAYGLYVRGQEKSRQRLYNEAKEFFSRSLEKDPSFIPANTGLAEILYKQMNYEEAEKKLLRVLSFDTYDPDANFLYGTIMALQGENKRARDAYGLALRAPQYKSTALYRLALIALKEKRTDEAWDYISQAIRYNGMDIGILKAAAVTARMRKDEEGYNTFLKKLQEIDPLNHFVNFDQFFVTSDTGKLNVFQSAINTELKHETCIELSLWYYNAGRKEEAISVLQQSPQHPLVNYLMAFILHQNRDENSALIYLEKALKGDAEFVFPYREEYLPVLEWANQKVDHWKSKYYLAILLWSRGQNEQAKKYFLDCGDKPDLYSFYLARAGFYKTSGYGNEEAEYLKALAKGEKSWRPYHLLNRYYTASAQHNKAISVSQKAMIHFSNSYIIRFDHAASLLNTGRYEESIGILKKTVILPFEGAGYGRVVWRDANVLNALKYYSDRNYKKALVYIKDAYLWPENLGVGRPYIVDERIEDFVRAMILDKSGKQKEALVIFEKIAERSASAGRDGGSVNYLTVLSLKRLNRREEADACFKKWMDTTRNKTVAEWSRLISLGKKQEAAELVKPSVPEDEGAPLSRETGDQNLSIINDIAQRIE